MLALSRICPHIAHCTSCDGSVRQCTSLWPPSEGGSWCEAFCSPSPPSPEASNQQFGHLAYRSASLTGPLALQECAVCVAWAGSLVVLRVTSCNQEALRAHWERRALEAERQIAAARDDAAARVAAAEALASDAEARARAAADRAETAERYQIRIWRRLCPMCQLLDPWLGAPSAWGRVKGKEGERESDRETEKERKIERECERAREENIPREIIRED